VSDANTTPVVILAFANDQDDYLQNIQVERGAVSRALQDYDDKSYIKLWKQESTSIKDFFDLFDRYAGRVAIFHYGGHANGSALQLEAETGATELANAGGLAARLGRETALQLVFLNGCATGGQVAALLAAGVKAVIATAVPINDAMATDFAVRFYDTLATRKNIGEAFEAARDLITTKYGETRQIADFRGIGKVGGAAAPAAGPELTWGLYTGPDATAALAWKLPEIADRQVIIRGAAMSAKSGAPVNDGLIQTLFNAVAPFNDELGRVLEGTKAGRRLDLRIVRQQIIDAFPAPVGEQLRKLFAGNTIDVARLRQIVQTYDTAVKLFAFAVVSQLWNTRFENPGLVITDAQWEPCAAFLTLSAETAQSFDYFNLILAIDSIFRANNITHWMPECGGFEAALGDVESDTAHRFMEEMRLELARGRVAAEEIESFCVQAEKHLGVLLSDFAFVVKYELATIKRIDFIKSRHKVPEYSHKYVLLNRITAGFMDDVNIRQDFSDNESVILFKSLDQVADNLNLTPFIVDENAFTGDDNSKLYFFAYHDAADDSFHYTAIDDADVELVISDNKYPQAKALFEEFRTTVARPAGDAGQVAPAGAGA